MFRLKKDKKLSEKFRIKYIISALLLAIVCCFNGCTFSTNIDSLLSPPKLSEEQEQIYKSLTNAVGKNINLQYPKTGTNLSSFIIADLDDDNQEEAIVFYKKDNISDENTLRINILDKSSGEWVSVFDRPAEGSEIEKIEIEKLGPSGYTNILVGYSVVNGLAKSIYVYQYKNYSLNECFNAPYNYSKADDFDDDGDNELFLIQNITNSEENSKAVIYNLDAAGLYHMSEVNLSDLASDYSQVAVGTLKSGQTGIYIDENVGSGTIQTEIIKVTKTSFSLIDYDFSKTQRVSGLTSCDIDSDGKIEIPIQNDLFAGYTESSPEKIYITSWYTANDVDFSEKYQSYYNISAGFAFVIPGKWKDKTTCIYDSIKEEFVFGGYSDDESQSTALLFIAMGKTHEETEDLVNEGYTVIRENNNTSDLIRVVDTDDSLAISEDVIVKSIYFTK
jgi:hypothetical protein